MKRNRIKQSTKTVPPVSTSSEDRLFTEVAGILEEARQQTVRSVNTHMVTAYWLIGWRIVEAEQGGKTRAGYGERLMENLSARLTERFGKGFSVANLRNFRNSTSPTRTALRRSASNHMANWMTAPKKSITENATQRVANWQIRETSVKFDTHRVVNLGWAFTLISAGLTIGR